MTITTQRSSASINEISEGNMFTQDAKEFSKTKWCKKEQHLDHKKISWSNVLINKNNKKAKKLSKMGRYKIENHSDDSLIEYHKKILSMIGTDLSERVDLFNIISIQLAYVAALLTVENTSQFITATTQMLVSVVCGTDLIDIEALKQVWIDKCVENQSLESLRESLEKFRQGFIALEAVPMWQQISRAFTLAAMVGFLPTKIDGEAKGLLAMGLNRWTKNLHTIASKTSILDLLLDSTIFACDFCNAVRTGTIKNLFSPDDVTMRATWLLSHSEAFLNGMLPENEDSDGFLFKVRKCIDDINILIAQSPYNGMLLVLNKFRAQLVTFLTQAEAAAAIAELRPAAPIFYLYGESQVGKSGLMNAIAFYLGKKNNFPVEQENFHYMSLGDKYDSGFTGLKTVIIQDDCAAEHAKYREITNVTSDIKHSNTVPYYSVQADITGKGKIPFRHNVKIKSGNTRDGGLLNDLSYPLAGTNRINFFEVALNKEYADSQGRFNHNSDSDYLDPKAHMIRAYWFENLQRGQSIAKIGIKYGEWMTTPQFLQEVDRIYKQKMTSGKLYVKQINNMRSLDICQGCGCFAAPEYCVCKVIEDQFNSQQVVDVCMNSFLVQFLARMPHIAYDVTRPWVYQRTHLVIERIGGYLFNLVFNLSRIMMGTHLMLGWLCFPMLCNFLILFKISFTLNTVRFDHSMFLFLIAMWLFLSWCFLHRLRSVYTHYLARELLSSTTSVVSIGLRVASLGVVVSTAFIALWRMRSLLKFENHGNLSPRSMQDIEEREKEVNPWVPVESDELISRNDNVANMTHDQVLTVVSRNVVRVEISSEGKVCSSSTGLMLCNNTLIYPTHALSSVSLTSAVVIKRNDKLGGIVKDMRIVNRYDMPNDFSLLLLTKSPAFRNLLDFFPDEVYKGRGAATMLIREKDLSLTSAQLEYRFIPDAYNATKRDCPGSMSHANRHVMKGMCSSPIVLQSCPSKIVSLHCGGAIDVKNFASSFSISKSMVMLGLNELQKGRMESHGFPGDRPFVGSGLNVDPYGDLILNIEKELHERDCVLYTYPTQENNDYCVSVHGSDRTYRSKPFSQVKISPLAPILEGLGKVRNYGPTPFKADRNYSAAWQVITDGGVYIPQNLLALATEDYLDGIVSKIVELGLQAQPLTMDQAINGIVGSKFVKRLDMKTSPGPGLASPKKLHFKNVAEEGERPTYVADGYVQASMEWIEHQLENGIVPEMLSKTALKDEPTKLTKDKVRVFCACSLPLNIIIRKYLLPILNNLYYIPFVCEMAQGINCTNDEWHQLGAYIREYGEDMCVAGDFSGYDARQTGQIQRATAWVFARLALTMGYKPEDADKVELLIMSLSAKYVLWNGTLVHIDGFMLSGSPVTIAINGVDNAIYHRLAYFHEILVNKMASPGPFRDHVRMIFVGDDSIGSSRLLWYNMSVLQRVFSKFGIKYTDAQKNLVATPFIDFQDMDFCKRNFRYEERVRRFVAPIKIDSIYKSLFCYRESVTSEKDIMLSVLRSAARELARHPEPVYNAEIAIIGAAARSYGVFHMVEELSFTYDYWWREIFAKDFDDQWWVDIASTGLSGSVSPMDSLDFGLVEEE